MSRMHASADVTICSQFVRGPTATELSAADRSLSGGKLRRHSSVSRVAGSRSSSQRGGDSQAKRCAVRGRGSSLSGAVAQQRRRGAWPARSARDGS
jgi:hypothetical protein